MVDNFFLATLIITPITQLTNQKINKSTNRQMFTTEYDVIAVGGGHASTEAAAAATGVTEYSHPPINEVYDHKNTSLYLSLTSGA